MNEPFLEHRNVKFWPWVGEDYEVPKGSMLAGTGRRLLVLGESHYGKQEECGPEFTRVVVQDHVYGKSQHNFFDRIGQALTGRPRGDSGDSAFQDVWRDIAFYNYVQEFVGETPEIRPKPYMWRDAFEPFLSVLRELKPTDVWVCGIETWKHMPSISASAEFVPDKFARIDTGGWGTGMYIVDGLHILVFPTYHPSARGKFTFKWRSVHTELKDILANKSQ